jgi:DNA (cytosine-5)-methyltransferase 1
MASSHIALKSRFQNPSLGRYIHPERHRVISLREGARIQGIPDDWELVRNPYVDAAPDRQRMPIPLANRECDCRTGTI